MDNVTYNQICKLIENVTQKTLEGNSTLFSSNVGLEPRDVLYIIAEFIDLNHIEARIMPVWRYNEVSVETLCRYCEIIKSCNTISSVEKI